MNIEKICTALSEVDELGLSMKDGCLVGQLINHCEPGKHLEWVSDDYIKQFKMLPNEYGLNEDQVINMTRLNDASHGETRFDRHTRLLAHYENLLIERLISEVEPIEAKV